MGLCFFARLNAEFLKGIRDVGEDACLSVGNSKSGIVAQNSEIERPSSARMGAVLMGVQPQASIKFGSVSV